MILLMSWKEIGMLLHLLFTEAVLFRVYIPCLYVLNKIDQISVEELDLLDRIPHYVPLSAHLEWNMDELLEKMWEYLDLIRL